MIRLRMLTWPRGAKQAAMVTADVCSYTIAATLSLWILSGSVQLGSTTPIISIVAILAAIPAHYLFGLYASIIRYMGIALLAIGLYQIVEMRIPDHAVVSETVEAARQLKRPKLAGLVQVELPAQ